MTEWMLLVNVLMSCGLVFVVWYLWNLCTALSMVLTCNVFFLKDKHEDYGIKEFKEMEE